MTGKLYRMGPVDCMQCGARSHLADPCPDCGAEGNARNKGGEHIEDGRVYRYALLIHHEDRADGPLCGAEEEPSTDRVRIIGFQTTSDWRKVTCPACVKLLGGG